MRALQTWTSSLMREGRFSIQTRAYEFRVSIQTRACELRVPTQTRACKLRVSDNRMKFASNETRIFVVTDSHYWVNNTPRKWGVNSHYGRLIEDNYTSENPYKQL